ncbi:ATP-binding protein [Streptomyces sp. NPDC091376]|uniref:sensor histidine kinase n=1 Tax=Streptomyces sp. NPDC091376 TaxID=3365994 RepID=UPI003829299B
MHIPRPRSLAGQLFAMQVVLVAAIVAGCAFFAYLTDREQAEETARRQVTATATAVADSPSVVAAVRSPDPTAVLQPYAERLRKDSGVNFVVIMAPDGTRWTHPEPGEIGRTYLGHIDEALRGRTFSETHMGVLGRSVRTVAPVREDGRVVALVSSGITIDRISEQVREQVTALLGMAGVALALGGVGTYVINARLRRHTHGMNASELSRMHDYHEATLHAVREGLLMLDGRRRIALINDGARELLGLDADVVGRSAGELGLPPGLTGVLLASEARVDELHLTADRVLVVSTQPVVGGERRGTVVTLRDHTELQALTGELDSERGFTQALRAQAHEAANRLHTVVSLIELGRADEAVEFATAELELAQVLTDRVVSAVGEPVLAALLLGKAAQANESGVELVLTDDSRIDDGVLPPWLPPRDLVTVLGNLIDNAVEASSMSPATDGPTAPRPGVPGALGLPAGHTGPAAPGPADPVSPASAVPADAAPPTPADPQPVTVPVARGSRTADTEPDPLRTPHGHAGPGTGRLPAREGGVRPHGRPAATAVPHAREAPPGEGAPAQGAGSAHRHPRVVVTARTDDGELVLRVSDSGPGVRSGDVEAVFERGWSTRGPGRGLGLALVRQAAHRGRGTVEVAQGPHGGAEFTVRLPLGAAEVSA